MTRVLYGVFSLTLRLRMHLEEHQLFAACPCWPSFALATPVSRPATEGMELGKHVFLPPPMEGKYQGA